MIPTFTAQRLPKQNIKGHVPRETGTGSNALAGAPLEFFGAGAPVVK